MSQSAASISMGTLAQYIRNNGYSLDMKLLPRNEHKNGIIISEKHENYPIVLLKVNFQDYEENIELMMEAKRLGMIKRLFLVGHFASLNAKEIMDKYSSVDGVIIGKLEDTCLELIKSINVETWSWDKNIAGGLWRDNNGLIVRNYVERLDGLTLNQLPSPARDIEKIEKSKLANIEFTRGCTNNCNYCHLPIVKKYSSVGGYEEKSLDILIEEIKELISMGKFFFVFNDSTFWRGKIDNERIEAFISRVRSERLEFKFMIYLTLNPFPNEKLIKQLREIGLVRIFIGVENNAKDNLIKLNKNDGEMSFEEVKKNLKKYEISYHIGYIIFTPFTTFDQVKSSIKYLNEINKIHRIGIIVEKLRLIPGSFMFEKYFDKSIENRAVDRAYQYKFCDSNVDILYSGLCKMFELNLKSRFKEIEVLCTSTTLAKSIALSLSKDKFENLKTVYNEHEANIKEYQALVYAYIVTVMNGVEKSNWTEEDISSRKNHANFINEYSQCACKLSVSWGKLMSKMNEVYNMKLSKVIFKGDERI